MTQLQELQEELQELRSELHELKQRQEELEYCENEEEYNDMLDDAYEPCMVGSIEFLPSRVLKELDPIAYNCGFSDFNDEELSKLEEEITELEERIEKKEAEIDELES